MFYLHILTGDPDYKSFTPGAPVDAFFAWPEGHDQVSSFEAAFPFSGVL